MRRREPLSRRPESCNANSTRLGEPSLFKNGFPQPPPRNSNTRRNPHFSCEEMRIPANAGSSWGGFRGTPRLAGLQEGPPRFFLDGESKWRSLSIENHV